MNISDLTPQELAIDLLDRSVCKVRMAAVLSDNYGIFAWGWNSGYIHAEEMVLMRANPRRVPGSTITVAGQRAKSGNWVYSFPCHKVQKNCLRMLVGRKVRRIVFLTKEGAFSESLV